MIIIYFDIQENIVMGRRQKCTVWRTHTYVYHIIIISLLSGSTQAQDKHSGEAFGLMDMNLDFFLEFGMWAWAQGEAQVPPRGTGKAVLVLTC